MLRIRLSSRFGLLSGATGKKGHNLILTSNSLYSGER